MEGENILVSKLNEFTRKYYKNKIIRGTLVSLGILLSLYLAEILKPYNKKITRLGLGLPLGGELEYADEETLSSAFESRK